MYTSEEMPRIEMAITGCYVANDLTVYALASGSEMFGKFMESCRAQNAVYEMLGISPILAHIDHSGTLTLEKLRKAVESTNHLGQNTLEFFGLVSHKAPELSDTQKLLFSAISRFTCRSIESFVRLVESSQEFKLAENLPPELAAELLNVGVLPQHELTRVELESLMSLSLIPVLIMGTIYIPMELNTSGKKASHGLTQKFLSMLDPEHPEILPTPEALLALALSK